MSDKLPVNREFAGAADFDAIVALLRAEVKVDQGGLVVSLDDLQFEWVDEEPGWIRDLRVWDLDGELIASFGVWHEVAGDKDRTYGEITVHPEWREPAFVDEVINESISAVSALIARPVSHRLGVADTQEWLRTGVERAGFTLDRVFNRMSVEITEMVPVPPILNGFTIRPLAGDHEVDYWVAAFNAGFADHHDPPSTTSEEKRHRMNESVYLPSADLVLVDPNGTIVGVGRNSVENLEDGGQKAWVNSIAVIPAWRGKGLGKALLAESMNALFAKGMTRLHLSADSDNATGALQIYEAAGFRVETRMFVYLRSIDPR